MSGNRRIQLTEIQKSAVNGKVAKNALQELNKPLAKEKTQGKKKK